MANDGLNLWPVIFSVDIMRSIDSVANVEGQVATELTSSRLKRLNPFPSALVKEVKHYYIRQSSFARANFHSGYLPFHGAVPVCNNVQPPSHRQISERSGTNLI